ncbi:hypothetical protein [Streptomyces wuyuanensis]|uniref:hypothetical protein n=1 Tax=Streptomyces wuyuanensis TaxID=1196353 RepID=UPI003792E62A
MNQKPDLTAVAAELAPLARVIARTLHDTPIHLGDPNAAPDLVGALTAAVAAYIGRDVLPPGDFDQARPPKTTWDVEVQRTAGKWMTFSPNVPRDAALEWCESAETNTGWPARVVRATTLYTVERPPAPNGSSAT